MIVYDHAPETALEVQAVSMPGEAFDQELLLTVTAGHLFLAIPPTLSRGQCGLAEGTGGQVVN